MKMRVLPLFLFLSLFSLLAAACSSPPNPSVPVNVDGDGVAIKGYDPVAYFTQGSPRPGKADFVHEWNGAKWHFASLEHLEMFKADPEKYAPRYGGYCAYAVSQGTTADIDPGAWRIVEGKLYLNLNSEVQRLWEQDIPGYIEKADRNWPAVLDRK